MARKRRIIPIKDRQTGEVTFRSTAGEGTQWASCNKNTTAKFGLPPTDYASNDPIGLTSLETKILFLLPSFLVSMFLSAHIATAYGAVYALSAFQPATTAQLLFAAKAANIPLATLYAALTAFLTAQGFLSNSVTTPDYAEFPKPCEPKPEF